MFPIGDLPLSPTACELQFDSRQAFALVAKQFRHVQLNAIAPGLRPRELDQSGRRDLLAVLKRHELTLTGFDLWIAPKDYMDDARADRAISALLATIELCADCGRVPVSVMLPAFTSEVQTGERLQPFEQAYKKIADHAARFGVAVADHSLASEESNSAERGLGVGIDPVAALLANVDPAEMVSRCGAQLISARLSDVSSFGLRQSPGITGASGGGRLDLMAYAVALTVAGYRRPVVLDTRGWRQATEGLSVANSAWESVLMKS